MDIAEFISARLDDDKAAANAGARRVGMPWRAEPQPGTPGGLVVDELGLVGSTGGRYAAEHIARHDPARTLREVAALRELAQTAASLAASHDKYIRIVGEGMQKDIALIWSDHADFVEEWRL